MDEDLYRAPAALAPRRPWWLRLSGLLVLPLGVGAYAIVLSAMLTTRNPNLFPTLLLIGAITVPLSVLLVSYVMGPRPDGHSGLVALTAVVGGAIGTTAASVLEYSTLRQMPALGMLAVGFIEEAVKLVMPLLVFLVARRRTEGLGVVLGVASGMGFAVLETMGYGFTALISSGGNVAAVDQTLLLRGLLSPAGHVAWTGMVTAALWRLGAVPPRRHAGLLFVGAFLLAVLLHTLWDGAATVALHVGIAGISVAILLGLVIPSRLRR
ncbi:Membrane proteinase PrsW, cleaves anti-sigma factor RsiW, M82 family [Raineyella antarctica]|uniref:Membrane proteinase PrsW, cleaves anti-sigma factor RsiW, M82 family n=1 Tax=Raineyella antarctica TaxID=1577474 RepID=A0A1G6GF25_9ACTN|nr:PrsW family intramembrane metalloprotease [Raineyella antarctica]SDB80443.1 Membrane proteinase PrsW, cleaves anti-sigma factor RsiW, M82 family [Raineyella antarctica]